MNNLVSVIIPTHNRSSLLCRSIQSVLKQSYSNLECIVVDDGSTDQTEKIVKSYSDKRIKYYKNNNNKGASSARNKGISNAKGELIAFLDDDDEWIDTKLEKQVYLMKSLPENYGLVYCWMDYYDRNNQIIKKHHPTLKGNVFKNIFDIQRLGGCPTLLVRRSVLNDVGVFDETLFRGNDGDLIRRIALKYKVDLIPEVLVKVFIGHDKPRIGHYNKSGVEKHIFSQLSKIKKFDNELNKYPDQSANIFFDLARNYMRLFDWRNSILYCYKGLNINPFSIKLYLRMLNQLKLSIRALL